MQFSIFSSLQAVYASSIKGSISHQNLRNCWVAKKLLSHTFFEIILTETIPYSRLKFSEITELVMLLPYSEVFSVSSDNDKHTVNEAQNVNKDSLWERLIFIQMITELII